MEFSRRNFLRGASASLIAAPAIVSIANIMPVRSLYKPYEVEFWVKGLKEITETNPGSRLDAPYYAEFDRLSYIDEIYRRFYGGAS